MVGDAVAQCDAAPYTPSPRGCSLQQRGLGHIPELRKAGFISGCCKFYELTNEGTCC